MVKLAVHNREGKESDQLELPAEIFGQKVKTDILHRAVTMYQACQRQGTASTKERAEVNGGGAKPYRQKGTGRARAGSSRSPLWQGGGVVFGPKPRDFRYSISKTMRKVALRESLNAKYKNKQLHCLDDLKEGFEKTKEFAKILKALKLEGKTLAVLDGSDSSINRVSRNIRQINLVRSADVNAYDVMKNKHLLVSKTAFKNILERVKK